MPAPDSPNKTSLTKPTPIRDPYKWETTKADPLKTYTRAQDDHGHSTWIRVRIHPQLHDLIFHIIGDKKYQVGWKNLGDAVRDSLVQRTGQVMEFADEGAQYVWHMLMRRLEWLEDSAAQERIQIWVTDACEFADRVTSHYIQRNQPEVGAEKLRRRLKELPHQKDYDSDDDDPDADYVASYIKAKIAELEDVIRGKFNRSS